MIFFQILIISAYLFLNLSRFGSTRLLFLWSTHRHGGRCSFSCSNKDFAFGQAIRAAGNGDLNLQDDLTGTKVCFFPLFLPPQSTIVGFVRNQQKTSCNTLDIRMLRDILIMQVFIAQHCVAVSAFQVD